MRLSVLACQQGRCSRVLWPCDTGLSALTNVIMALSREERREARAARSRNPVTPWPWCASRISADVEHQKEGCLIVTDVPIDIDLESHRCIFGVITEVYIYTYSIYYTCMLLNNDSLDILYFRIQFVLMSTHHPNLIYSIALDSWNAFVSMATTWVWTTTTTTMMICCLCSFIL